MISISEEPQFSAEDIYEIPAGVGRTTFEFDMNLIKVSTVMQKCTKSGNEKCTTPRGLPW